jgi:hypothetical protein
VCDPPQPKKAAYQVLMSLLGLSERRFATFIYVERRIQVLLHGKKRGKTLSPAPFCVMSLVVLTTICILACGFFLYVLLQWLRDGKRETAPGSAADQESWRSRQNAQLKVVSFRKDAGGGVQQISRFYQRLTNQGKSRIENIPKHSATFRSTCS